MHVQVCIKMNSAKKIGCDSILIEKMNINKINNFNGKKTLDVGAGMV